MGENYLTWTQYLTNVAILVPGMRLGAYTLQNNLLMPRHVNEQWPLNTFKLYMAILLAEVLYFLYQYLPSINHQNSPEECWSHRLAAHWWIYYYVALVVTPSQLISGIWYLTRMPAPVK